MKTQIFYFSGTGNSLRVARDLAAALGEADVVAIPRAMREKIPVTAGRVGLVFPVYMWGLPAIVDRFCRQLKAPAGTYCFAVATCGASAGGTLAQLEAVLRGRGLTLSLGCVLRMPGNYTPLYGAPSAAAQEKAFAAEKAAIPEIARQIAAGAQGRVDRGSLLGRMLSKAIYRAGMSRIAASDVKFRAEAACNGCGLCARVCPVDNIVLQAGRPVWRHHCEQCMACLQWCPQEAIEFGSRTSGRKRYHHPDCTAADFLSGGSGS